MSDCPNPGRSGATTWNWSMSRGMRSRNMWPALGKPCSNRIVGAPVGPASRENTLKTSTSTFRKASDPMGKSFPSDLGQMSRREKSAPSLETLERLRSIREPSFRKNRQGTTTKPAILHPRDGGAGLPMAEPPREPLIIGDTWEDCYHGRHRPSRHSRATGTDHDDDRHTALGIGSRAADGVIAWMRSGERPLDATHQ